MAATLDLAPPSLALSGDSIFVKLSTELIAPDYSFFEFEISDPGPADTQEMELAWPGGGITYTAATAPDGTGLQWPLKGAETLSEYADKIAEVLRQREDVMEVFKCTREGAGGSGELIRLTRWVPEVFALEVVSNAMSNVTAAATNAAAAPAPDNLRALVEVFADTGTPNEDYSLLKVHGTYAIGLNDSVLDVHAAFAHLGPHMPDESSIVLPNTAPSSSWYFLEASKAFQKYYLRYADKYGSPAVAEAMVRTTDSYHAIFGAHSGEAKQPGGASLVCHDYNRRDGKLFRKPVSPDQPDWGYWFSAAMLIDTELSLDVVLHWSDGTQSIYEPFSSGMPTVSPNKLYVFATGYLQLRLNLAEPEGATDEDAFIVGYDVRIGPLDDSLNYQAIFFHDVDQSCHPWNKFLLFSNGYGGMETAWFRGKATEKYDAKATEFQIPRWFDTRLTQKRDYLHFEQEGRMSWEVSTGWFDDPYYPEHLRQCALGEAWLIDMVEGRFLPVLVEGTDLVVRDDDEPLVQLTMKFRAAWFDPASNL